VSVTGGFSLGSWTLSEQEAYYIFLALFAICTCPFCFFDFQKTKYATLLSIYLLILKPPSNPRYMQFATMFTRNAAFTAYVEWLLV